MRMFVDVPSVYLCADAVDFRKSINGLAALVEAELELCSVVRYLYFVIKAVTNSNDFIGITLALRCGISD